MAEVVPASRVAGDALTIAALGRAYVERMRRDGPKRSSIAALESVLAIWLEPHFAERDLRRVRVEDVRELGRMIEPDARLGARRQGERRYGGPLAARTARRVTRDGGEVAVSTKEFDLLAYFLRHPLSVVSREQILSPVWGYSHDPRTNIVEVYVSCLRRRLSRPGSPAPIVTVRSVGYRLAPARG